MESEIQPVSKKMLWAGYIISALPVLMLLFSASMKFLKPAGFADGIAALGWTESQMTTLGFIEIGSTIIYLIPRTSVLGAILLTGYLGGATATHVRIGDPSFITPAALGVLVWLGLWLRDSRLRALIP